jgi:hypothetical protein
MDFLSIKKGIGSMILLYFFSCGPPLSKKKVPVKAKKITKATELIDLKHRFPKHFHDLFHGKLKLIDTISEPFLLMDSTNTRIEKLGENKGVFYLIEVPSTGTCGYYVGVVFDGENSFCNELNCGWIDSVLPIRNHGLYNFVLANRGYTIELSNGKFIQKYEAQKHYYFYTGSEFKEYKTEGGNP